MNVVTLCARKDTIFKRALTPIMIAFGVTWLMIVMMSWHQAVGNTTQKPSTTKIFRTSAEERKYQELNMDIILELKKQLLVELWENMKKEMLQNLKETLLRELKAELKGELKHILNVKVSEFFNDKIETEHLKDKMINNVNGDANAVHFRDINNGQKKRQERGFELQNDNETSVDNEETYSHTRPVYRSSNTSGSRRKMNQYEESYSKLPPGIRNGRYTRHVEQETNAPNNDHSPVKRAITGVAFSAYLDHSLHHLSVSSTVKFNKVLLNDGGAYNQYSGTFTVPISGVYILAFEFLSSSRLTVLRLMVDNVNQVDGKVQYGNSGTFGLQGGNVVMLRLQQGQSVWVENYKVTDAEVDSGTDTRFTTFSGALLY